MGTEKLKFKIELYGTMWDKPPHVSISIDGHQHFDGDILGTKDKPNIISFVHECDEDKEYNLDIARTGKTKNQTVVNEKGDILNDQLLHIKSIEIDEINIGSLVYDGVYTPEYPEPWATQQAEAGHKLEQSFTNATDMGHNGHWNFKFKCPFYLWLLENLY